MAEVGALIQLDRTSKIVLFLNWMQNVSYKGGLILDMQAFCSNLLMSFRFFASVSFVTCALYLGITVASAEILFRKIFSRIL